MSDEWAPPPSPQDYQGKPSDGVAQMLAKISGLQRQLDELRSNTLKTAGISVEENRIRFGGNVAIEGTLSLPAGIIDNDALANPIAHRSAWNSVSGFALANAWTDYVSVSLAVPEGFTRMQFTAIGTIEGRNDTGSTQYLMTRIWRGVNGAAPVFASVETRAAVPDLYRATGVVPYVWGETVTPGDVHTLVLRSWVGGGAWSPEAGHVARLEVTATFSRS